MISEQVQKILNDLMRLDFTSASLYLAISNYLKRLSLKGMGHWLRVQYNEERGHALKINDYLLERSGVPVLLSIAEQQVEYGTPLEAFSYVLAHEQFVTKSYIHAFKLMKKEDDPQAMIFLQDYLTEQAEEEANVKYIVERLALIGDNKAALLLMDEELGERK